MRSTLLVLAIAVPGVAHARPFTAGASLGMTQSEADSTASPDHTLSVFGRMGIAQQLWAQLELGSIDTSDRGLTNVDIKSVTAGAVLDLVTGKRLVPLLLAGIGYDRASESYGEVDAHRFEAGVGLEYRASGGFVVGIDARIGARTVDSNSTTVPAGIYPVNCCSLYATPAALSDGQYRSVRATVGVRF